MECEVLITQDAGWRKGGEVPLKRNADEALERSPGVKTSVVWRRVGGEVEMRRAATSGRRTSSRAERRPGDVPCEPMDSEDLLYLLYTSGTTAKPKGIVHTTGGYLTGVAATHHYIFDVKADSVYWCAADIGWVTGHSYIVYGPLANATTGVLYEGVPDFPDRDRWWAIIERYKVDILYTAPTAIRAHMKWGPEHAAKHDLSSLRLLGSVGEPINPEAWIWYREHIGGGRCPIVDTWWQTETGMILITPLPGVTTTKPGSATRPFPGIDAAVVNDRGEEVPPGGGGYLVLRQPWPAMLRGIYKDHDRFVETYWSRFPGMYFAGDGARIDEDGDFWLMGRVDDVMNVSGHRISTIEVESALVDHPKVAEAAVCGRQDETTGQAIVAFVSLKGGEEGSPEMMAELREHVATKIGKIARPANIVFTPELRRPAPGRSCAGSSRTSRRTVLGDTTTLADPTVVEEIKDRAVAEASQEGLGGGGDREVRPFVDADVDAAAGLLTDERHERHRAEEPLLAPVEDARARVAARVGEDGTSGAVAVVDGELVGYLLGSVGENEWWGRHVWVGLAGHAAREAGGRARPLPPRGRPLGGGGARLHVALVPRCPELAEPWFRLAFAHMQAHGIRESGAEAAASGRCRRPGGDDRRLRATPSS